jgi:ABC-type sugar transport system substrate-binding protein
MKRRRLLGAGFAMLATMVVAVWLVTTVTAAQKVWVIGYNAPTSLPFDIAIQKGMRLQAKKLGVKVVVAGGKFDPAGQAQLSALNSLIDRGLDALIVFPINPPGQIPAVVRAQKKGIKILDIEPAPGMEKYLITRLNSDDFSSAKKLGVYAAGQVGKPCKAGIVLGLPIVPVLQLRNLGYQAGLKAAGCEILDKQVSQDDQPATATTIANTWKTKYGSEMNLIMSYNDPSAFGVLAATGSSWAPKVVGMNGDEPNIQAVKDGRQLADGAVDMPAIGNGIIWAAVEALKGHKLPKVITTKINIWTKANVNKYLTYNQRLTAPMNISLFKQGGLWFLKGTLPKKK